MTETEFDKWMKAEYPYDFAECGICATCHEYCYNPEHAEMRQEAKKLGLFKTAYGEDYGKLRSTVLAFREKFAEFYTDDQRGQHREY
jgi:hypothetical protein